MTDTMGALDGVRVIDFGQYLAAPWVGMMLADYGAEVIRVDPPGGPRWDHPANAILHRGKRSIVLDLKKKDDLEAARKLIASADIVLENFRPGVMARLGLSPQEITAAQPELIWCSIPGFGSDDPRALIPAWEGVVCSAGGLYCHGFFNTVGDPTFTAIPLASFFGAAVASHGVAAALFHRERTGLGQLIEIPLHDACFEAIATYGENPILADIGATHRLIAENVHPAMMRNYKCRDGRYLAKTPPFRGWVTLGEMLIPPDLLKKRDEESIEKTVAALAEAFATKTAVEWEILLQEQHEISVAAVQSTRDFLEDDQHARDSQCVIEVNDPILGPTRQLGFGVTLDRTPAVVRASRQLADHDGASIRRQLSEPVPTKTFGMNTTLKSALEGITVVDVSILFAGPIMARVLAYYGADVIKISNPESLRPDVDPLGDYRQATICHTTVNDGKRSTFIDLKKPEGREIIERMIDNADVVHQMFTPGVAERLGFGEADARKRKSDVIYSSLNLHAQGGFREKFRGHEECGQYITGVSDRLSGDGEPKNSTIILNDHATGHLGAFGVIVALYHRARTGEGQHVRSALSRTSTAAQLPFMINFEGKVWDEPRGPGAVGWGPLDRIYPSAAGHFYLAAKREGDLQRLANVPGLQGIEALSGEDLQSALEERFKTLPAATWAGRISAAGIGAHVYRPIHELMEDPLIKQRGLSIVQDHLGIGLVRKIGAVGRFSRTPPRPGRPVPAAGLDTVEVLEKFGFGDRVGDLIERDVVYLG